MNRAPIRVALATASSPGAVAIVQLSGAGIAAVLQNMTGVNDWPIGRVRLVNFADIDDGMAVLWREEWAQIMPHGGPHVVRKLLDRLVELGCVYENDPPARRLYPEAASDLEADMLATLARAASPAAIDLLLEQPRLWRDYIAGPSRPGLAFPELISRSDTLDRLVTPPCVVVVGRPNVGKSTLTNRMLGRAASIVADLPGTTRDWVAGLAEINGIAVRWLDTPGIRASDDPIERRAIELAADAIRGADVVIAMRDGEIDWPEASSLPRTPDIRVINKIDRARPGAIDADAIAISAATGDGVDRLERAVVESLGLSGVVVPELWAFSRGLKRIVDAGDWDSFTRYAGVSSNGK